VGNRVLSGLTAGAVLEDIPGKDETSGPAITIKPWDPAVPYLRPMREAGPQGAYAVFLKQRPQYASSPGFYLDCADYLLRNGQKDMGLRVLGDVAALKLENAQLLRVAAGRFAQEGEREMAIEIYQKVLKLRPEEPQSSRDLALALADRADAALLGAPSHDPLVIAKAQADYQRALDLLTMVIMGQWDNRFPEIQVPVLMEANRIIAIVSHLPGADQLTFHNPLDGRLVKLLDLDVRIVLDWDADLTDVDLWVIEPSGEKCVYNHNRTTIGGLLSHDITQGYGPEEYCLRQAMPGQYKIQANYFGSQQLSLAGPVTVRATVITHFGRPDEQHQTLTLRLDKQKDVVDVGSIVLNSDVATFLKQQAPTSPSFQEPLR